MEQYREQYREETAQVHAPTELIERTKAAVRAEEERVYGRKSSLRKWTYPLTAAAALLILASVSLTMRGLKSENMSGAPNRVFDGAAESGAAYESAAVSEDMDAGYAEGAAEAAAPMESVVETAKQEDALLEDTAGAAETESAAADFSSEDRAPSINETQKSKNMTNDEAPRSSADTEESEAKRENTKQTETEMAEDSLADMAAGKGGITDITIEKVEEKPAFCDRATTRTRTCEDMTFRVAKEGSAWVAYVEIGRGEGYVLHGEMEDMEEFLEAGCEKIKEQSSTR